MELYLEQEKNEEPKSKSPLLMGILIFFLIILAIVVIGFVIYLQNALFKVRVNGSSNNDLKKLIIVEGEGENTKLYFPIREVATYLGYNGYTGDFKSKSEDSSKRYIDNGEEMAMFTVNTDSLIISSKTANSVYEEYTLDEDVFERDGKLYTSEDGLIKAFHVTLNYTPEKNLLEIYTTDYLTNTYVQNLNLGKTPKLFRDRQAILEGMVIVETENPRKYGVMNVVSKEYALEPKYDSISYIPYSTDFLVQSEGKYGIMTKEGRTKINIAYDSITLMDNQIGLYLVKEDNLYGVINDEGKSILKASYQQIGVNNTTYAQNSLDNQYILADSLIPVKYNNMWGFFDTTGKEITNFEFTGVGCSDTSLSANTYPTVEISSLKLVVVEKDRMYNLIYPSGQLAIKGGFMLNSVYLTFGATTGQTTY